DDPDDDDEREIRGTIEAISADSVTVSGKTFVIDSETQFFLSDGTPGVLTDFEVGASVELIADLEGTDWIVRKLRLKDIE
ncbi:MAG: DUF5666 domain-containing protein, partial [bacterium]|nr:DUF5666 domain-containing protein [bacterium]